MNSFGSISSDISTGYRNFFYSSNKSNTRPFFKRQKGQLDTTSNCPILLIFLARQARFELTAFGSGGHILTRKIGYSCGFPQKKYGRYTQKYAKNPQKIAPCMAGCMASMANFSRLNFPPKCYIVAFLSLLFSLFSITLSATHSLLAIFFILRIIT